MKFLHTNSVIWKRLHENIKNTLTRKRAHNKGFTHDGVSASDRGCVAGDSKAAGARVEASRMSPVHLTAMQGVVLGREGQWLPFLGKQRDTVIKMHDQREALNGALIKKCQRHHYASKKNKSKVWKQSLPVCLGGWWQWRDHAGSDGGSYPAWQDNRAEPSTEQSPMDQRAGGGLLSGVSRGGWGQAGQGITSHRRWEDNEIDIWDMSHFCDDFIKLLSTIQQPGTGWSLAYGSST